MTKNDSLGVIFLIIYNPLEKTVCVGLGGVQRMFLPMVFVTFLY